MKFLPIFFINMLLLANALACTNEFSPVCGYWMHNARTETFQHQCQMREHGAKLRHEGSCLGSYKPQSIKQSASTHNKG
jgi:hypothetical protein